jgi:mevalonate kinase
MFAASRYSFSAVSKLLEKALTNDAIRERLLQNSLVFQNKSSSTRKRLITSNRWLVVSKDVAWLEARFQ